MRTLLDPHREQALQSPRDVASAVRPVVLSCLMPTFGRHAMLPRAVAGFLAQAYDGAELVIVSEDGVPETIARWIDGRRVRHVACPAGLTLGAKRNLACAAARGAILVHWDDDDWQAPDRLRRQAAVLERPGVTLCGSRRIWFRELDGVRAWAYRYDGERLPWVAGGTFAFRRSRWERAPFEARQIGEDNHFVWASSPGEVIDLDDPTLCVAAVHSHNTSRKNVQGRWWRELQGGERELVHRACDAASAGVSRVSAVDGTTAR